MFLALRGSPGLRPQGQVSITDVGPTMSFMPHLHCWEHGALYFGWDASSQISSICEKGCKLDIKRLWSPDQEKVDFLECGERDAVCGVEIQKALNWDNS